LKVRDIDSGRMVIHIQGGKGREDRDDECTRCGHRAAISYNSCRNRHCPKCQTSARERWIQARCRELLPTPYVHVFSLCLRNWLRWLCRTRKSSMVCWCAPAQKLYSKWLATPGISAPR